MSLVQRARRTAMPLAILIVVGACGQATTPASPAATPSQPPVSASSAPTASKAPSPAVLASQTPGPTPSPDPSVAWILYQAVGGMQLIRPDGTDPTPILRDLPGPVHADWSPDGQRITFNVDDPDGTRDIWTSAWDGSRAERLVDCQAPCRDADSPAWSPDGKRIAFSRIDNIDGHNPGSKIQAVDLATGAVTSLVATKGAEYAGAPRWSPDGGSLVVEVSRFVNDGNDTTEMTGRTVAILDLSAAKPSLRTLQPLDAWASYPDWHPTADLILFAAGPVDPLDPKLLPQNLFTIRPDGTGLTQITSQGPAEDGLWMPAFRRDGSGILATLVHRPNGNLTLAALQIDGSGLGELGGAGIPGAHSRQRP